MLRMLVVDDEIDICDFVKNFFKERSFDVFVAHNGEEALSLVETKSPDIILLDLKMPVMDGMKTLAEIRRTRPEAKVIVVTAVEDKKKCEEAKRYGVVDYITKPLLLEQLERKVLATAETIRVRK
ncbi:MAG: response regulator [Candidatus Omnitrophota bacterium]